MKKIKQGKVISPANRKLQLSGPRRHLKGGGHTG